MRRRYVLISRLLICLCACVALFPAVPPGTGASSMQAPGPTELEPAFQHTTFMPLMRVNTPWQSPFGIQADIPLTSAALLSRATDLRIGWARRPVISWRQLQPQENGPIRWELLEGFEQEIRALKAAGIVPEVVVLDSPRWATINEPFPTACGAIRPDKFQAFAEFMRALVTRYKAPEFGIHHWELGNEIDVDPTLVAPDNGFGCWGDIDDPYYGGRHYGEMLKVVTPAIKAADPNARVWLGGLLLDRPLTTDPAKGRPELFLQGVLEAGAGPYFDILPYHAYPPYYNRTVDHDLLDFSHWAQWGGFVVGKARYLRQIMAQYGVHKPLFLNETSLMCPDVGSFAAWCDPPALAFYEMQANHLVRSMTRGLAHGIDGLLWYTLEGPGWRNTGLLEADAEARPAYVAFQQLEQQLRYAYFSGAMSYGEGVEAYIFRKGAIEVQVVWAVADQTLAITTPAAGFVGVYSRDGEQIVPPLEGGRYRVDVSFEPIYIVHLHRDVLEQIN